MSAARPAPPAPPGVAPAGARPRLLLLAAAALFSTGGSALKATQLTAWQVASLRSGVAALVLLALVPATRRGWSWRTALVGLPYAASMLLFVQANLLTTAANAIFLQSTASIYLLLLSPWLLRERIQRRDVSFLGLLLLGMTLFFLGREAPQGTAPDPARGNLLAAASGLAWALTIAGLRWLARDDGTSRSSTAMPGTLAGNALACVLGACFAFPLGPVRLLDAALIAYLGVFQIGLAYVCLNASVRRVPAFEASLLLLAEPVLSTLLAWAVHGEVPGPHQVAGSAVILAATAAHALAVARPRSAPAAPLPRDARDGP